MTPPRLRAVVLAAGHGMRLRPLTAELPKGRVAGRGRAPGPAAAQRPLLAAVGRPLSPCPLEGPPAAGVEATAINLHHRAEAIPAALGDVFAAMPLGYSREQTLLGTLGGTP